MRERGPDPREQQTIGAKTPYEPPQLTTLGTVDEVTESNESTLGAIDSRT